MTVELPTTLKQSVQNLTDFPCLFIGEKTSGKSSLIAQWPSHFILEFEVGNAKHIEGNWVDVPDWDTFVDYRRLLTANPTYCKALGMDGMNTLDYYAYVKSRQLLKMAEIDKDNYDVWGLKRKLLKSEFQELRKLPCTILYTAHTEVDSKTDIRGREVSRLQCNFSKQMREFFDEQSVAVWGVLYKDNDHQTLMQIKGDSFVMADHKLKDHFRWNGYPIKTIPLGFSPEEAFRNFNAAFNNQLPVADIHLIKTAPQSQNGEVTQPTKPKVVFKQ